MADLCVGHSFVDVAHFVFLRDVWIRTQRAGVASRRATNLTPHLPLKYLCLFSGEGGHKEDPVPPDAGQEGEGIPGLEGDKGGAEGPEEPHLRLQAGGGLLHRPGQAEQVSK